MVNPNITAKNHRSLFWQQIEIVGNVTGLALLSSCKDNAANNLVVQQKIKTS